MGSILKVTEFSATANKTLLVDDLSFEIAEGKITGIVGESGSGKSVTCMGITNLLPKNIRLKGKAVFSDTKGNQTNLMELSDEALRPFRGREIAYIFQEPMTALNPVLTCGYQVEEALRSHQKMNSEELKNKVLELFKEVRLPDVERIYKSYPHQISGGQRQRVMISMAVSNEPRLLIADEPTTALDASVQKSIIMLLEEMVKKRNMAMIFISHDLNCLHSLADEILVMYNGKMVESGNAEEIFNHPRHPYTKALMKTRPKYSESGKTLPTIPDLLQKMDDGSFVEKEFKTGIRPKMEFGEKVLQIENLYKSYGKKSLFGKSKPLNPVLKGLNFELTKGETLGIVGESGCGKSTLAKILTGLEKSSDGSIRYYEQNLQKGQHIQMVFQDPFSSLNPSIMAGNALTEPLMIHKKLKQGEAELKALDLLELTGLSKEFYYKYPHQMSGGQRQRLCIARALSTEPSILILDEAVAALDVSVQSQILNLLKDLQLKLKLTYLFISHDLNVVGYISDKVMVLKNGEIEEMEETASIFKDPKSQYTRFLLDCMYE
ncbi:MAG: ABC transporter ATP-binding protein [Flavobacteriales bacterium]|nr:ABC transporter ATP-binding protein [Flavobacteriales bacterium]